MASPAGAAEPLVNVPPTGLGFPTRPSRPVHRPAASGSPNADFWRLTCRIVTRLSVIVPCYNVAPFLTTTLASLHRNAAPDVEFVLVDDGSTDGTSDLRCGGGPASRRPAGDAPAQPRSGHGP